MKKKVITGVITLAAIIFLGTGMIQAQEQAIRPISIRQSMPDFTLPVFQGGEFHLENMKGKNVILIFPRGLAGKDHWCHICNYQYAEWVEAEKKHQIRKTLNTEIVFIFPYGKEMLDGWMDKFTDQLTDIENYKNPPEPEKLDERGKSRLARMQAAFPKSYTFEKGKIPMPFPILLDAERKLSSGLGLFTMEWSGSKIDQNIPSIFILDKEGKLQFKYISQNTFDRPGVDYLLKFVKLLNSGSF